MLKDIDNTVFFNDSTVFINPDYGNATFFSDDMGLVNQFVLNAPFLYPLETSENCWCFQGVEKGCIGNKWVNVDLTNVSLDDNNFDSDDPETTFMLDLRLSVIDISNARHTKKR